MTENQLKLQQKQRLSQSIQRALQLLTMDRDALSEHMLKAVQDNPALEYVPANKPPQEYEALIRYRGRASQAAGERETAAPAASPRDELLGQLRLMHLGRAVLSAAKKLVYALTPRGYFPHELAAFAKEEGIPLPIAQQALDAVHMLEPVGVGARDARHCLHMQLAAKNPPPPPLCDRLVDDYMPDIAAGNLNKIAKAEHTTAAHVRQCVDILRTLSPVPCSLQDETPQYILPEFSVEVDEYEQISIFFPSDYYPTFRCDESFRALAKQCTGDEKAYAQTMLQSANQLLRAWDMRQTTMEKMAALIVRKQRYFFLGRHALLPLRMADVAAELGVHESTAYRAVQNKYLCCKQGTLPLSAFFQRDVGNGLSRMEVQRMIREICQTEGKLSDREIAERLDARGVQVSRRTVAKYRGELDIASSYRRKGQQKEVARAYENP